jgi:hypothetical protein
MSSFGVAAGLKRRALRYLHVLAVLHASGWKFMSDATTAEAGHRNLVDLNDTFGPAGFPPQVRYWNRFAPEAGERKSDGCSKKSILTLSAMRRRRYCIL